MIPTKNDNNAMSTHARRTNAKDKPSIGSMLSMLVRRTRSAKVGEWRLPLRGNGGWLGSIHNEIILWISE
jgi:hypothetical protein